MTRRLQNRDPHFNVRSNPPPHVRRVLRMASVMGRLTTHILDTERGRPASGVAIDCFAVEGEAARKVGSAVTNGDGRTDAALVEGEGFAPGAYELRFHVGPYLAATGRASSGFLDTVVIRFSVTDASEHLHVPLLLQAHGYATYRGS